MGFVTLQRQDLLQLQLIGRQGARLVHAEHVHVAERFDRVGLLHERPVAGHAHRREGVGDGDGDEEAVGDEPHQHGGLDDRLVERDVEEDVLDDEQQLQVEDDGQRHADDRLDLALQRRQRAPEGPRTGGDAPGQAGLADRLGHVAASPGGRDSCRSRPCLRLAWARGPIRRSAATRPPRGGRRRAGRQRRSGRPPRPR